MKQTIRQVLDDMKDSQINLGSLAARETMAKLITTALKSKGNYTEFQTGKSYSNINDKGEQSVKETWVCNVCDENTYDVDSDYIGSGTNHLQCELKLDLEEEVIGGRVEFEEPETKHFADGFHEGRWEDDVRIVDDAGVDIETGKATFPGISAIQNQAYNEMTADGLPPGGDVQAVIDSHRLAEEIVDNKDEKWIYESPDGGKTVFRRPFGDLDMKNKVEIDWETKEPTGRIFTDYPFEEKGNER